MPKHKTLACAKRNLFVAALLGLLLFLAQWKSVPAFAQSSASAQLALLQELDNPTEKELRQIRDQEITQLKIVMGRRDAQNRRPDLLLRLAELYTEEYRHYFLKENELHQIRLKSGRRESVGNHEVSRRFIAASNNAGFAILATKQRFAGLDKVYFILGYNFGELGKKEESKKYYSKLVSEFPRSPMVAEAYRALGESAFERGSYSVAIENLENATRRAQAQSEAILPRTLYKLAWAYYKSRRISDALSTMKRAISLTGDDEKFVSLREEALNDIVVFYVDIGKLDEARSYFSDLPGGERFLADALTRLAKTYERAGKFKPALTILEGLVASSAKQAPDKMVLALAQIIEIHRKNGDQLSEERSLKRLVKFFQEQGEDLRTENEDTKQIWLKSKAYLRARATEQHKTAQRSGQNSAFSRAAELYALYRDAFLHDPKGKSDSAEWVEFAEILTYQADCLLRSNQEMAGSQVLRELFESKAPLQKRREAGLTLANLYLKKIDAALLKKRGSDLKTFEKQLAELSEKLEDDAEKTDPQMLELKLKRLRLSYMIAKDFPEEASASSSSALKDLIRAIEENSGHSESGKGALEALRRERTQELAERFAQNRPLLVSEKSGELAKAVQAVQARESFAASQNLESEGKFSEAAKHYSDLADQAHRRREFELRDKSWNNAAISFERAGLVEQSLGLYEKLTNGSDKARASQAKSSAVRALLTLVLKGQFETAANLSLATANWNTWGVSERYDLLQLALNTSLSIREQNLAWSQIAKVLSKAKFLLCEDKKNYAYCFAFLGAWFESFASLSSRQIKIPDQGLARHMDVIRSYGSAPALTGRSQGLVSFFLYELSLKAGLESQAQRQLESSVAAVPQAALLATKSEADAFHGIKIEGDDATVKVRTEAKIKRLQGLVSRYESVLKLSQAAVAEKLSEIAPFSASVGIQALSRLALAYLGLAENFKSAPVPKNLNPEAREKYLSQINRVAGDFLNKSKEFISKARSRCHQLQFISAGCLEAAAVAYRGNPQGVRLTPLALDRNPSVCESKNGFCLKLGFEPRSRQVLETELLSKLYESSNSGLKSLWIDLAAQENFDGRPEVALLVLRLGAGVDTNQISRGLTSNDRVGAGLTAAAALMMLGLPDKAASIVFTLTKQDSINTTLRYNALLLALAGQLSGFARENASVLNARWEDGSAAPEFAKKKWPLLQKAAKFQDGSLSKSLWLDAAEDLPHPSDWLSQVLLKETSFGSADETQARRAELDAYPELQVMIDALAQGRL